MKTFTYTEKAEQFPVPEYYKSFYPESRLLFFDIETTGFAAKNTTLYLIGALWYEKDSIQIIQWFNDDGYSEKEIVTAFDTFCKDFTHLVHFNGLGFDLPYLRQKADLLDIPFSADQNLIQIDIFKEIRSYKKIFFLDSMKQVSIEDYLGIHRKDTYTGKELINIYQRYVALPDYEKQQVLLLHNHDDLLGMPQISHILNYKAFFEQIDIISLEAQTSDTQLNFRFTYAACAHLPKRLTLSASGMYLNALEQKAVLSLPIVQGTLMHYFEDYKNYYYLPQEDMAIHKSVAAYVAAENKEKATKSTCYIKKTDAFIPCFSVNEYDAFKYSVTDKCNYQTLDSLLLADESEQISYIKNALTVLKNHSKY